MCVAEYMIPRVILRLIQHLRINSIPSNSEMDENVIWHQCEQVGLKSKIVSFELIIHEITGHSKS